MAEYFKLGDTEIHTGSYSVLGFECPEPPLTTESRDYANKDGAEIVSRRYGNSVRTLMVRAEGSSKDNLFVLIQALQDELRSSGCVLEYKSSNATNSNYSDVLTSAKKTELTYRFTNANDAIIEIVMECKPFWRASQVTIAEQTLSPTPNKLTLGTIKGDVPAPCSIEIAGVGANSFGANLVIGTRATPMSESLFNPIKDFQGATLSGAYNGKATDKTVDTNWTSLTGEATNINGVAMESATVGVAVGDGGKIWTTANGWATVNDIAHGLTSQNLNDVKWAGGTTYFVCGNAGVVLKSTNSGAAWAAQTIAATEALTSIDAISTSVAFVVGLGSGKIYKTTNGGTTWVLEDTLALGVVDWSAVSAADATNICWAVDNGGNGLIYRSTDGGSTFSRVKDLGAGKALYGIDFGSAAVGWACGQNGTLYKTSDTGATWTAQTSGATSMIRAIKMQSATVGWFCGDNGVIRKTTDGAAWTAQTSGTPASLNAISVVDASNVNIGGDGYTMLDTADGGTTWTQPIAAWALTMDYEGRYRVYARIKKSASGAGTMRVSSGWAGGSVIANTAVDVTAGTSFQWVDLGEVSIPATTLSDEVNATPILKVEGKMGSGSETWSVDVAVIMPVDGEACLVSAAATAASHISLDSDKNAVNQSSTIVSWIGSPIILRPGDNGIVILETAGIDDATFTVKYYPLYLLPVA